MVLALNQLMLGWRCQLVSCEHHRCLMSSVTDGLIAQLPQSATHNVVPKYDARAILQQSFGQKPSVSAATAC
jgi:hypothetical protein